MSDAPEQEDRRSRRRSGLLWGALVLVMAALVSVGTYAVLHNGSSTQHTVDAGGTGTAPVLDSPPVDIDRPTGTDPLPTATSSATPPSSSDPDRSTRTSEGGGALAPHSGATTPAALDTPRPHGLNLILTSTLSDPLRPGFERALYVNVRNVNTFPVDLYRVDVRVDGSPKPGCLASWVKTGHYRYDDGTPRRVPASSSVVVTLPIELVNLTAVDQNACQGTYFPLRLSGIAVDPA